MVKSFNVVGVPTANILYRGMFLRPKQPFDVVMTDNELSFFKDYINITSYNEVVDTLNSEPQNVKPIIEEKPKEKENVSKNSSRTSSGKSKINNKNKV